MKQPATNVRRSDLPLGAGLHSDLCHSASPFAAALRAVIAVWFVSFLVFCSLIYAFRHEWFIGFSVVALGSLFVAVLSMLPGLCLRRRRLFVLDQDGHREDSVAAVSQERLGDSASSKQQAFHDFSDFTAAVGASMLLRGIGTVALFLIGRYQLPLSDELTALFVTGWYVLLTLVEVSVLANQVGHKSQSSQFDQPSPPIENHSSAIIEY